MTATASAPHLPAAAPIIDAVPMPRAAAVQAAGSAQVVARRDDAAALVRSRAAEQEALAAAAAAQQAEQVALHAATPQDEVIARLRRRNATRTEL
jgi:hypothetical protein